MKEAVVVLLSVFMLVSTQEYLPKEPGYLPINDLYARDIARSGLDTFWKVDQSQYALLISSFPVRPNAITKVTIYLEDANQGGAQTHFGCGKKQDRRTLERGDPCWITDAYTYWGRLGTKLKYNSVDNRCEQTVYGSPAFEGDNITMTIDMRPYQGTVSFAKNGLPMGIAFAGLHELGDVYIYITLNTPGNRIKITDYQVI